MGLATNADRARLTELKADASRRSDGTRDLVGMRKQAVLATEAGELLALHSGDGHVLWHARLDSGGLPLIALQVAKVPHVPAEDIEVRCRAIVPVLLSVLCCTACAQLAAACRKGVRMQQVQTQNCTDFLAGARLRTSIRVLCACKRCSEFFYS